MIRNVWCCLTVTALLFSGLLGALTDGERLASFESLVAKNSQGIPRHLIRWLDSQTKPLAPEAITGNYEHIKKKIGRISKHIKKPATVFLREENRPRNVLPAMPLIDETRTLRHIENFYINANDVLTPLQEYIVGQAPLEDTIPDFWRTILEAKVPTIITLSMPQDVGGKTSLYWEMNRFPMSISGWKIERDDTEEVLDESLAIPSQRIIKRAFLATHEKSGETRKITHIHYENWPDNGAPEPLLFYRFIHLISQVHPLSSVPIFVHCAAGIGRSGTFVTAHSLCKEIDTFHPTTINIPKRIIELRMQRAYLVSTTVQIAAIYEAMRTCAQDNGRESSKTEKSVQKA